MTVKSDSFLLPDSASVPQVASLYEMFFHKPAACGTSARNCSEVGAGGADGGYLICADLPSVIFTRTCPPMSSAAAGRIYWGGYGLIGERIHNAWQWCGTPQMNPAPTERMSKTRRPW